MRFPITDVDFDAVMPGKSRPKKAIASFQFMAG
jgi:hypothetical protein